MSKQKEKSDIKDVHSPYLAARREWNERYGDYISQKKMWQAVGLVSLLVAAASVGGVTYFAGQNKLIPYTVEVDEKGATVRVYEMNKMQPVDQKIIRAQLAQFIKDVRTVSPDLTVMKNAITRLYTHLNSASQASTFLNEYFAANSPFERAKKSTVGVEILQLLPLSDNSWQIEWSEQEYGRDGKNLGKRNYTATVSITVGNTVNEVTILDNPVGMEVENIHWSADFQNKADKGENQ